MKKELTTKEILDLTSYYNVVKKDPAAAKRFNELPIATRWAFRRAILAIMPAATEAQEMLKEMQQPLIDEFATKEKSIEVTEGDRVYNKVKDEYLQAYKEAVAMLQAKENEFLEEKMELDIPVVDMDAVVSSLPANSSLTLSDLELLSLIDGKE